MIVIVGLGNPGEEYKKTRHNAGRMAVEMLAKQEKFDDFVFNKKANALIAEGKIGKEKVMLMLPETMMNNSGKAVMQVVKSVKAAKGLLVLQDELDLPLGVLKMVFARGSGGHKGVESVMRAIKTDQFARIRIGISAAGLKRLKGARPNASKGSVLGKKKDEAVIKHVIGAFKPAEEAALKKSIKKAAEAAKLFASEGINEATQFANTK